MHLSPGSWRTTPDTRVLCLTLTATGDHNPLSCAHHPHLWWAEEVEEAVHGFQLGLRLGIRPCALLRLLLHHLEAAAAAAAAGLQRECSCKLAAWQLQPVSSAQSTSVLLIAVLLASILFLKHPVVQTNACPYIYMHVNTHPMCNSTHAATQQAAPSR